MLFHAIYLALTFFTIWLFVDILFKYINKRIERSKDILISQIEEKIAEKIREQQ